MRIGFIGLGIMGEAMCYNIIRKHDGDVYIYDVKTEPVQRLAEKGGIACDSAVDAAKHSDVIITMLPRSEDSLSVYKEILPVVNATKICIDMSTIDPSVSLKISVMIQAHGGHFLDAPVVKSKAAAVLGNIGIYVGGEKEIYFQVKPILQYMGSNILYMGSSGKGIGMKICQTTLLAQIQNGVNEALAMAVKQGIDVDRFTAPCLLAVVRMLILMNVRWPSGTKIMRRHFRSGICPRILISVVGWQRRKEFRQKVWKASGKSTTGHLRRDMVIRITVLSLIWSLRKTMSNINLNYKSD